MRVGKRSVDRKGRERGKKNKKKRGDEYREEENRSKEQIREERRREIKRGKMAVKANSTQIMVRGSALETMEGEAIEERNTGD